MTTKTLFVAILLCIAQTGFSQANIALSNLVSPTSVNQHLIPSSNNVRDLGSAAKSWRIFYLDSAVYLKDVLFVHNKGVQNAFVGSAAGNANTSGRNNTAFGYHALYSNKTASSNTALGTFALVKNTASNNTAIGYQALYSNTTATLNTAVGYQALYSNITGSPNTAVGWGSLNQNVDGKNNTAMGFKSLFSNATGEGNVALGEEALNTNTLGSLNVGVGYKALSANKSSVNVAVGALAMLNNNSGQYNAALGYNALGDNTTGENNVVVGGNAGNGTTTASGNVIVGAASGPDGNFSNNVIVGTGAHIYGTNSVVIGTNSYTNTNNLALLGNTTTNYCGGYVNWTNYASDRRLKAEVKQNVKGLEFINRLRPVTYHLDLSSLYKIQGISPYGKQADKMTTAVKAEIDKNIRSKESMLMSGFIAQEVEQAAKESGYDFDGVKKPQNEKDNYGLSYSTFVVPLVKAVQELSSANDSLKNENAKLVERLDKIEALLKNTNTAAINLNEANLAQNSPNPFNATTIIAYYIPQIFKAAKLVVYDASGKVLKQVSIRNAGSGTLKLNAATLAAGAYNYSLFVDGNLVATKKMMLSR